MLGPDGFGTIRGDTGFITVAGAKAGIVKMWTITRSGTRTDGKPRLRFRAQFSWVNEALMNLRIGGQVVKKRVIVQMKTKYGMEEVDIIDWEDSRLEGGVLTLENITHFEGVRKR
ncbi:MAG TPA: hypothetical protein VLD63_10250 [Anaerolineales bacterium]|nr:hypothetical protein [Anaerolineales bacterium]